MSARNRVGRSARVTARRAAWAIIVAALAGTSAAGQSPTLPPQQNAVLARAQALATAGNRTAARSLVDSVLADTDPSQAWYADALYLRGTLAPTPADGRKDLLRLVVDFPFSTRVGDALFRLSQHELDGGDRVAARRHLERLVRDHAAGPSGAEGAFQLGRLLMEDGDVRAACVALDSALAHEPVESVERRNRIAYLQRPCDRLRTENAASVPQSDSIARGRLPGAAPARGSAGASAGAARAPNAGRGTAAATRWSAQVAALEARADAAALAGRLKGSGHDARVTGTGPFRVRIGRFATRAEAAALVSRLRGERMTAIVVEAERP